MTPSPSIHRFTHLGYAGTATWAADSQCYHGRVDGLRHIVAFMSDDLAGLEAAFREAVEDYLEACAEDGATPGPPAPEGEPVLTHLSPDVHRRALTAAGRAGVRLEEWVARAVAEAAPAA